MQPPVHLKPAASPVKDLSVECDEEYDHSSSSDQLSSSGRVEVPCPLMPRMPVVARDKRSATTDQQPLHELASLHAALSREGVPMLRSPQEPQQQWPPQQQQQAAAGSLAASQHHAPHPKLSHVGDDVQSTLCSAGKGLAQLSAQLGQVQIRTMQRPPTSTVVPAAALGTLGRATQHVVDSQSLSYTASKGPAATAPTPPAAAAAAAGAGQLQCSQLGESSGSGSSTCSSLCQPSERMSSVSSGRMLPQANPQQQRQQQQHELLGTLSSGKANLAAVAAFAQQVKSSSALQRLQQPQQPQQQPRSKQDLAAQGLQQLADVTEAAQLLNSAVSMQQKCTISTQQTLTALHDVFTQHPQAMDATRLQQQHSNEVRALREELEVLQRALAAKGIAEQNILGAAIRNAHTPRDRQLLQLQQEKDAMHQEVILLRLQKAYLQQQVQQQQHSDEGRGDASEVEDLSPVVQGQRYDDVHEGQQVRRTLLEPLEQAAAQAGGIASASGSSGASSRGSSDRSGSSAGGSDGSSRSWTPDSRGSSGSVSAHIGLQLHKQQGPSLQQQQPPLQRQQQQPALPVPGGGSTTSLQLGRELAAGRFQAPQAEVKVQGMQSPLSVPTGAFNNSGQAATPPGQLKQLVGSLAQPGQQPYPASPATSAAASPTAVVQRLRAELHQAHTALVKQQQQYAGMRVNMETAHKRQLDTERRRLEAAQQQYDWVKQQNEQLSHQNSQLAQQLQVVRARQQHQGQQPTSGHHSSNSGSSGSTGSSCSDGSRSSSASVPDGQQQQRLLQQESVIRELSSQLQQARGLNTTLQQRLDTAVAQVSAYKDAVQQQAPRLLQAETALKDLAAARERARSLAQQVHELQQQLAGAQQAQAAAEGAAQECKRQLAAADAERAVLKDRVRQLADRVLHTVSSMHHSQDAGGSSTADGSGSNSGSSAGSSMASGSSNAEAWSNQQQQQQLVSMLRAQLSEAEAKQERLQVVNAQLQERLGRLTAQSAAREALDSSIPGSLSQQQQQQQLSELQQEAAALQHDKQHLQQQVEQLQQQLASATALSDQGGVRAPAADAMGSDAEEQQQRQQQHGNEQQQQQQQQQQDSTNLDEPEPTAEQLAAELEDRTQELLEWQTHAEALEQDLEMLKARVAAAEGLQEQLDTTAAQLAAARSQRAHTQKELEAARARAQNLDYELHGVSQERAVLRGRVDALTAELADVRQGAGDLRVRLEHFTGPKGPQARVRQLEGSIHTLQRKLEAANSRSAAAAAQVKDLQGQLSRAEDKIVELEGHMCLLEDELARHAALSD